MPGRVLEPQQAPPARAPASEPSAGPAAITAALTPAVVQSLQATAGNRAVTRMLLRQSVQTPSGTQVGDLPSPPANLREDVLAVMDELHRLWTLSNKQFGDEYPLVEAKPPGSTIKPAEIPITIAALKRNERPTLAADVAREFLGVDLTASVGEGMTNARDDILALQLALRSHTYLDDAAYESERAVVEKGGAKVADADMPKTCRAIALAKAWIAGGRHAMHGVMTGVRAPTSLEHAEVEAVLHPGSKVVITPPVAGSADPVTATVEEPAKMTGKGKDGPFEKDMIAALKTSVKFWADDHRAKKKAGPPAFPMAEAGTIAKDAQEQVESYFAPWIQSASREIADLYHPGKFKLDTVLGDQSKRKLDDSQRWGWTNYWMTLDGTGAGVLTKYNVLEDRDGDEFSRVAKKFALSAANRKDIDDAIHGWPAEAGTAIVYVQPYNTPDRTNRWDLFTTLIHEMMHKVAHPNFERTANAIGGSAQKYMTEGFADLMRRDLWFGPGKLGTRIGTPAMAPVRERVEGGSFPYDASVVKYHDDYTEVAEAQEIAAQVGMPNCRAAFFLGRTDMLGIGAGTAVRKGVKLDKVAGWTAGASGDSDVYVAATGDTYDTIKAKAKAAEGGILDDKGAALATGAAVTVGQRLRIPGIRWVNAIQGDTLKSLAEQHAVSVADLAAANGYPAAAKPETTVVPPKRLLIPIHAPV